MYDSFLICTVDFSHGIMIKLTPILYTILTNTINSQFTSIFFTKWAINTDIKVKCQNYLITLNNDSLTRKPIHEILYVSKFFVADAPMKQKKSTNLGLPPLREFLFLVGKIAHGEQG